MGPTLRIVCVNDIYSLENLPRLASLIRHHRDNAPADRLLVTLAGDFVAPSLLSGLDAGRGMVDCLNAIGVTHASLGNHEDDIATDDLRRRIDEFRGVWLSTNVQGLHPKLQPFDKIQIGRIRLGLVGVVMDDSSAYRRPPFGGNPIAPPNQTALAAAAMLLNDQACDCVIAMTHQSVALDRELARTGRFPLILGGHEHTVFLEQIDSDPGTTHLGTTHLIKAGVDAEHAIIANLRWPPEKPVDGPDSPSITVHIEDLCSYPEDAALRARVFGHTAKVRELENATLETLAPGELLSSTGARRQQTTLGSRICSRIRDALGAEACLINGGGIRANRDYSHHFTYADVKAELPFDNGVVVARLPGAVIRDAVAASRARAPQESGGFLQVDDGMQVDAEHRVLQIGGSPLDPAREYRVALVRDLFGGMDHQEPLLRFARENPGRIPPEESGREIKHLLVEAFAVALWKQLGGFDRVDLNHDGTVTEEELAIAVARITAEAPSALAASLVMHALNRSPQPQDETLSREQVAGLEAGPAAAEAPAPSSSKV